METNENNKHNCSRTIGSCTYVYVHLARKKGNVQFHYIALTLRWRNSTSVQYGHVNVSLYIRSTRGSILRSSPIALPTIHAYSK